MSFIYGHNIVLDGKPVNVGVDNYPQYGGQPFSHQSGAPSLSCLHGLSNRPTGPCRSVMEHVRKWLEYCKQIGPNSYGAGAAIINPNWQWPVPYLNSHQANLLQQEIAMLTKGYERLQLDNGKNRVVAVSTGPVICKKCFYKNEYGANNQKDGTYVCYMCR